MKQIIQKTEKWPKNWEIHLLNTSKLYFEDKELEFRDGYTYHQHIVSANEKNIKNYLYQLCLTIILNINNYSYFIEFKNKFHTKFKINILTAEIRYL